MRRRVLPEGWYPGDEGEIREKIDEWAVDIPSENTVAGLVPHAGWAFCGPQIASVLRSFPEDIETIVVLGGHNPSGGPFISYGESVWDLPSGLVERDSELAEEVESRLTGIPKSISEGNPDNTVEVVMAMATVVFRKARWAAWRIPSDERAMSFGEALAASSSALNRRIAVLGSTDLTHYGPNYGFMPPESREDPRAWTAVRDRRILDAFAGFKGSEALRLARVEHSACSAGGGVAAMSFAGASGAASGRVLSYRTSHEVHPSSSFVGYGAVVWETA